MSDFRQVIEILLSPPRVWTVMLDVERWPEWNTAVTRVQRMDVGPLTLGSRTRIWQPRLMPAVWQVTSARSKAPHLCLDHPHLRHEDRSPPPG